MAKVITLDIHKVGYGIHDQADSLIRNATEPTIVEMVFVGNTQKRYSRQCLTDDTVDVAVEMFTNMLARHDWYYDYSDDGRVWREGQAAYAVIQSAREALTKRGVDTDALYNHYCPFGK